MVHSRPQTVRRQKWTATARSKTVCLLISQGSGWMDNGQPARLGITRKPRRSNPPPGKATPRVNMIIDSPSKPLDNPIPTVGKGLGWLLLIQFNSMLTLFWGSRRRRETRVITAMIRLETPPETAFQRLAIPAEGVLQHSKTRLLHHL